MANNNGSDPLWYKDAIIYELHVKAFCDKSGDGIGDFRGLIDKLDYIKDLGVTAIWLLPFYPSPQKDDGYDIADYRGVHPDYGTLRDFRQFVREAHTRGLKVITTHLHVAATLAGKDDFEVLVAGGMVRSDGGVVGQAAVDFIQQFKVDFALVGISGIDEDGSLLDFDFQEVRVSQTIIDNARQVFLAADSSKFGRNAVVRLGSLSLVDRVFTDHAPPAAIAQQLQQQKIRLDIV